MSTYQKDLTDEQDPIEELKALRKEVRDLRIQVESNCKLLQLYKQYLEDHKEV